MRGRATLRYVLLKTWYSLREITTGRFETIVTQPIMVGSPAIMAFLGSVPTYCSIPRSGPQCAATLTPRPAIATSARSRVPASTAATATTLAAAASRLHTSALATTATTIETAATGRSPVMQEVVQPGACQLGPQRHHPHGEVGGGETDGKPKRDQQPGQGGPQPVAERLEGRRQAT